MSDFVEHMEECGRIVAGWPKWKRDVLQFIASEPDGDTERTTRRWLLSVQCDETTDSISVFANDHSKPLSLVEGESIRFEYRSGVTLKLSRIDTREGMQTTTNSREDDIRELIEAAENAESDLLDISEGFQILGDTRTAFRFSKRAQFLREAIDRVKKVRSVSGGDE